MKHNPGIGATPDLSLRVSVASLVRVVFKHPGTEEWMLALERKVTLRKTKVEVKSQPFGGAVRILDLDALQNLIGDFHFDSTRSCTEQDFRLFIRPSAWPVLREFCIQHLSRVDDTIIETDPRRELVEEFFDALKINLKPEQFVSKPVATVVENEQSPTENIHANGYLTVRVYRLFEASINDSALVHAILKNSESLSDQDLHELALADVQNGGNGRENAMLVLNLKHLSDNYSGMLPEERNAPVFFEQHRLDETVSAVLEGITVPKYQRIKNNE